MAGVNTTGLTTGLEELAFNQENKVSYRGSSELGKEEFLQLLVCQLQNQDPLNPQSDQEFIAQLAQFSSLEQMTNMNATMSNNSAYSLVGKEVIAQKKEADGSITEVRGTVDYVDMKNGDAHLSINGKTFTIDELVQIMDMAYAAKDYLPTVEEQVLVYDISNPTMNRVKINLGSNGYEANSVALAINGKYIDSSLLTYDAEKGILSISPESFNDLEVGSFYLGFYFDDPYATSVTDKVTVKVLNSGIDLGEKGETKTDDEA